MRKQLKISVFVAVYTVLGAISCVAQSDNDKQLSKLQARISVDSAKLVKFKSLISTFENDRKEAADNAQQSADDNRKAAQRLSDDPQDKRLARKADNAASNARRDAKKARVAADKLDDLNKDIKKLSEQLEKEQTRLQQYQQAAQPEASDNIKSS